MLTQATLRDVLSYDPASGIFRWKVCKARWLKPGDIAGAAHNRGYWQICIDQKSYLAHRLAWLWVKGDWPKQQIDHIDGNRQNNAITNLREASPAQNSANSGPRPNCKTGIRGVYTHKPSGRFRVQLRKGNGQRHVGYFDTLAEAEDAALHASLLLHQEFSSCHRHARKAGR